MASEGSTTCRRLPARSVIVGLAATSKPTVPTRLTRLPPSVMPSRVKSYTRLGVTEETLLLIGVVVPVATKLFAPTPVTASLKVMRKTNTSDVVGLPEGDWRIMDETNGPVLSMV